MVAGAFSSSVFARLLDAMFVCMRVLVCADPEVKTAIERLPPHEAELRLKRIKRALDLSMKKTYLAEDIAKNEDVWQPYIRHRVELLKAKRQEKIELGE